MPVGRVHDHPILHFVRDGANFSLNSDDPTVIGTRLAAEYETVRSWGLTEAHLLRANLNAARSSFLPEDEKKQLVRQLYQVYGMEE